MYTYIFRVKFPLSIYDVIESKKFSPEKQDILIESLKMKFDWCSKNFKSKLGENISYILIGDKYALFNNIHKYIYNSHILNPNLKICFENLIQL